MGAAAATGITAGAGVYVGVATTGVAATTGASSTPGSAAATGSDSGEGATTSGTEIMGAGVAGAEMTWATTSVGGVDAGWESAELVVEVEAAEVFCKLALLVLTGAHLLDDDEDDDEEVDDDE